MKDRIWSIIFRYLLILVAGLGNLFIFYKIFFPLTIYPVFFILNLFYSAQVFGDMILIGELPIRIVDACVAGAAYYLLFILTFSLPLKIKKQLKVLGFVWVSFLIVNLIRIIILSVLAINGSVYFEAIHLFTWNFISIAFVLGIWFFAVKYFKVEKIPFYSDLKTLYYFIKK